MLLKNYLKEISLLKLYILSIILIITFSYSIYIFCSDKVISVICDEDNLFEWLTAMFFLFSSVLCFATFKRNKNIFVLGLALMFFMGMGEEISWGQRQIGFDTPAGLQAINVQHETNIHNIEFFNGLYLTGVKKTGLQRLFEINILFRMFSVSFLIMLPLLISRLKLKTEINKKLKLPIAPVTIGAFFLISWCLFYSIKYFLLPQGNPHGSYLSVGEVFEFTAAYVYFVVALFFYNTKDDSYLGANAIQATVDLNHEVLLPEIKIASQSN